MISYLIHRPIAVLTGTFSLFLLGVIALFNIPVSLMPDIDIPEITIRIEAQELTSFELEKGIVEPLKRSLLQTTHLDKIHAETTAGGSTITLGFKYGTDIDFAYIEVNEKLDRALISFPKEIDRPRVIKASASDIPIFFLDLTLKKGDINFIDDKFNATSSQFLALSKFSREVLRKRIEQLPGVALADISGMSYSQITVLPIQSKINALGITLEDIETAISQHNQQIENLTIRNNQYSYHVRLNNLLTDLNRLKEVAIIKGDRVFHLKELAQIREEPQSRKGMVLNGTNEAISIAIIKQSDARISDVKAQLSSLIEDLRHNYPEIQFDIIKDQSLLLNVSIQQLLQSFLSGITLAFIIMFVFLRNFRAPLLIGISIPVSLILAMLLFYQFDMSINIVSLSGLILGVGLMVDNSIIVIDNISQYREKSFPLAEACALGAQEVFRPLLSSALTTCAVFLPLIFLSGMAGTLFFDQAIAISIGLFSSLLVSIILIPVLYRLLYLKVEHVPNNTKQRRDKLALSYHSGLKWVLRNQLLAWILFIMLPFGTVWLYFNIEKTQLPELTKNSQILKIDWLESIHLEENKSRILHLIHALEIAPKSSQALIGNQQFLSQKDVPDGIEQSTIYLEAHDANDLEEIKKQVNYILQNSYPSCQADWEDTENIFTLIFPQEAPTLTVKLYWGEVDDSEKKEALENIHEVLKKELPEMTISPIIWKQNVLLEVDFEKLVLYEVDVNQLYRSVKSSLNQHKITSLSGDQKFMPVILGTDLPEVNHALSATFIQVNDSLKYPIRAFFTEKIIQEQKAIQSDHLGEYHAINLSMETKEVPAVLEILKKNLNHSDTFIAGYSGSFFDNQKLIKELTLVLLVSILILYFILSAQFESLTLPLIILIEIPMDMAGSFLLLALLGHGINLMSMIGIIVMSGIIINDSILKIDTINQLRKQGCSLTRAIIVAGKKRLKPILMTSMTTILALVPLMITSGLGSELQRPLAIAVIGGISLGTIISIYFIPLCYYQLCRKS